MINKVRKYIQEHQLLSEDLPVLVGLSGGADSVALVAILKRLGYVCIAAHCNFHLRGTESDRDEVFACCLAEKLNIPFIRIDFDTVKYAAQNHLSIEMAARELRYQWFEKMRVELQVQAIAVAHHQDDSVETFLLNLVRGTGVRGLTGISPKNGYVVRPMLSATREEILFWLGEQQLEYVNDSTNADSKYKRNFIRLQLIPLLETLNPSIKAAISRTSNHLLEVEHLYESVVEEARKNVIVDNDKLSISELLKYPSPKTILYELLKPYGFTRQVSDDVYKAIGKEAGKQFYSQSYRLVKDRDYLLIATHEEHPSSFYILSQEEKVLHKPIELSFQKTILDKTFQIEKDKRIAYFDYDKLYFPLTIRQWQAGDWLIPFGMKGRKKLSNYFSDHKFSRIKKEQTWLLCSGDNVIWIIGERSDNRFRIDGSTKQVLIVKFSV